MSAFDVCLPFWSSKPLPGVPFLMVSRPYNDPRNVIIKLERPTPLQAPHEDTITLRWNPHLPIDADGSKRLNEQAKRLFVEKDIISEAVNLPPIPFHDAGFMEGYDRAREPLAELALRKAVDRILALEEKVAQLTKGQYS